MLDKASVLVNQNGYIIYMACSFFKNETVDQINSFLKKNSNFLLLNFKLIKENINYSKLIKENFMITCIALMWVSAVMSAAIDNIPFTAAMIPIIASLETVGVNIAALCWCLAIGVGMGGNGTHIGSTANVYIVTVSEKLAKTTGNPDLAITPLKWAKKGLPVMLLTLVICTIIMIMFFDYYALPLHG